MRKRFLAALPLAALLAWYWSPSPAQAFGDCASTAYMRTFDARLTAGSCHELARIPVTGGGNDGLVRLIKPAGLSLPDEAGLVVLLRETIGRISAAMTLMGSFQLGEVTILLTDLPPRVRVEDGEGVSASAARGLRECLVTFHAGDPSPGPDVVFFLAHEMFHCIQYATWPDSSRGPEATWWSEGSAEYFAHLTIPGTDVSDEWVESFDALSPTTPLIAMMGYEAVVFFSWYGDRFGPAAVRALLDGMRRGGADSQRADIERMVPQERLQAFAQDYIDKNVRYPGGASVPVDPRVDDPVNAKTAGFVKLQSAPLVIARKAVDFRAGLFETLPSQTNGTYAGSNNTGEWAALPFEIEADCEHPRTYFVTGISARSAGVDVKIDFKLKDEFACADCEDLPQTRDACVVGTWRERSSNFQEWMQNQMRGIGSLSRYVPGNVRASFRRDGGLNATLTGRSGRFTTGDPRTPTTMDFTYTRLDGQAFWSADGTTMAVCGGVASADGSMIMNTAGRTITMPLSNLIPPIPGGRTSFQYRCSGDSLHAEYPVPGAGPLIVDLERVR